MEKKIMRALREGRKSSSRDEGIVLCKEKRERVRGRREKERERERDAGASMREAYSRISIDSARAYDGIFRRLRFCVFDKSRTVSFFSLSASLSYFVHSFFHFTDVDLPR